MSSAIVQHSGHTLSEWSPEQINIIKQQIAPKCSDEELALFGQVCQRTGLDPFARQIYAISRWDKQAGCEKMSIQTSIDGYRLIADRTGKYAGSETFWCGADGDWKDVWLSAEYPAAAKTMVYKLGSDRFFSGVALFSDYKQEFYSKQDNSYKLSPMWKKMPTTMIAKCSEALALRKAFPAELSGLYTREEMMQSENDSGHVTAANSLSGRYNFIASKTGHTKRDAVQFANLLGIPPSTQQMTEDDFVRLRGRMLADWGMAQGGFNHLNHAKASLAHLSEQDDSALWEAWQAKVNEYVDAKENHGDAA